MTHPLESCLQAVLERLEAGEAEAADALLQNLAPLLVSVVEANQLERLRALHQKCVVAANGLQASLMVQLRQTGTSRRAEGAYTHPLSQ